MRAAHRIAALGVATAAAVGGLAGSAAGSVAPHATAACTLTVVGPAYYYPTDAFTKPIGGKHSGDRVTSSQSCATYTHGFHQLTTSHGSVYMYTTHLVSPSPRMPVVSTYTLAADEKVRTAPNPKFGTTISVKKAGSVVSSPWPKGYFPNGYAQVILGNGNSAWMPSTHLH